MKVKNLLRMIIVICCGAVLGLNIYSANARSLVGNQLPMPFGYGMAVVLSGSMEPTLSVGDLLIVKEKENYELRDVVVFQDGKSLVVHRIVEVGEHIVTTQGDANNVADNPIDVSVIKGEVIVILPYIGTFVNLLKTPIGTFVVIVLAIALLEIPRRREQEKDDEERQKIMEEIRRLKDEL